MSTFAVSVVQIQRFSIPFFSLEKLSLSSKSIMDTEKKYSMLAYINSTFKADSIGIFGVKNN